MPDTISKVQSPRFERHRLNARAQALARVATDWAAVALLLALTTIVVWNRASFDMWLARVDMLHYYLPNYGFLGQQLRELNVPGWSPHQFAGQPFAADPQSGWMQLPVMVLFALLDPLPAAKALFAFNLCLGVFSTYAYARILAMGILASIVAAIAFGFGNLIHFNTYCCTPLGNFAPWIPLALLSIELALRARSWVCRLAAIFLTGLALSQMLAAWTGQGTFFGLMVAGGYVLYRTIVSPVGGEWSVRRRLFALVTIGPAVLISGLALAAAGILPRLDVNRYTSLRGGNYEAPGVPTYPDWSFAQMLNRILDPAFAPGRNYLGTVALMLAMLAPIVARRRFAVPFHTGLTIVGLMLALGSSPLHQFFFLIPRFRVLHEHSEERIMAIVLIGPAMLAAASVESLIHMRVRLRTIALACVPALGFAAIWAYFDTEQGNLPRHVWYTVFVVTLLLAALLILRVDRDWQFLRPARPLASVVPMLFVVLLFLDPSGKDIVESLRGHSNSHAYQVLLDDRGNREARIAVLTDCKDRNGAGSFLVQKLNDQNEPFRYFGFEPTHLRYEGHSGTSYHAQVASPLMQSLLVGTRATCLGLYDIQGYNPVQLQRYVDFLRQINGVTLNYHDGVILQMGIDSPLLNLLNPAYIIVPSASQPTEWHVGMLPFSVPMPTVFKNQMVRVVENPSALPHAWIVHDVRQMPKEEILWTLDSATVDPQEIAFVEKTPPPLGQEKRAGDDSVRFTSFDPDSIGLDVEAAGDGMLVLSEIFVPGWNAYIDGKKTDDYATDYALRGVALTAGGHHIELRYEPASLRYGVWISLVAGVVMLAMFGAAGWCWLGDRRRQGRNGNA